MVSDEKSEAYLCVLSCHGTLKKKQKNNAFCMEQSTKQERATLFLRVSR